MAKGDKSSYTDRQKRKAEHIEEDHRKRGGKKSGSSQVSETRSRPPRKDGKPAGRAAMRKAAA